MWRACEKEVILPPQVPPRHRWVCVLSERRGGGDEAQRVDRGRGVCGRGGLGGTPKGCAHDPWWPRTRHKPSPCPRGQVQGTEKERAGRGCGVLGESRRCVTRDDRSTRAYVFGSGSLADRRLGKLPLFFARFYTSFFVCFSFLLLAFWLLLNPLIA